jgi:hypothetical protein
VRVRNKRYTLAVRQLIAGETTSDVLAEFLELLDGLDLSVKPVSLDRGFYNSLCLGLLSAHNSAYAMPVVKWGETIQTKLNRGWSREIEHHLAGDVAFPAFIDCVYRDDTTNTGWRVTAIMTATRIENQFSILEVSGLYS